MFALFEPLNLKGLVDRPDLGCAMLIAACHEKGIDTTLIKGQTYWLENMFNTDSEELWNLIRDLKECDLENPKINEYKQDMEQKGLGEFQSELKELYEEVIINKNPRIYLDGHKIYKINKLTNIFLLVYRYYIEKLDHFNIAIMNRYVQEIERLKPRYIGFSIQLKFDVITRKLRQLLKERTDVPIIIGGSITPFLDLEKLDRTFAKEYCDYLVVGAGERALPALIKALELDKEPEGIDNVLYKTANHIKGNNIRPLDNLDELSYPDFSQFDLQLYLAAKKILPLQTARGCTWRKCAFCAHSSIYFDKYERLSVERVVDTIQHLKTTYDTSYFAFHDEELPANRCRRISQAMLDKKLEGTSLYTYARFSKSFNDDNLLALLYKAGFSTICWGMESGCQKVLDLMDKGTNLSTMSEILKKSSENGIMNLCFQMFGFPGEDKKDAEQTVRFLSDNADYIDLVMSSTFHLAKNTPIYQNPEKWGVEIQEKGHYLRKNGMSEEESQLFHKRFLAEKDLNRIKVTSGKFSYTQRIHLLRMMFFLMSGHELLSQQQIMRAMKQEATIFPILLGELKRIDNQWRLSKIDVSKSLVINDFYNKKKDRVLTDFEKEIFLLSDGKMSIWEILSTVHDNGDESVDDIQKKCLDFYQVMFSEKQGIGFAKSWN